MRLRRRTAVSAVLAALVAAATLSACESNVGTAASIGRTDRVSEGDVANYLTDRSKPYTNSQGQQLVPRTLVLQTILRERLMTRLLAAQGATPTAGQLAETTTALLQGETEQQLTADIVSTGFAARFEPLFIRSQALVRLAAEKVNATTFPELSSAVDKLSLPVRTNPRYGPWQASTLSVGPVATPDFLTLTSTGDRRRPLAEAASPAETPPLQQAVEVMDRLRSPGGCPWDAAQTHTSLARYLVEETYETLEAIETGDTALLREELGDLLLQVLFHARLAEELPAGQRFTIDDVARDLVAKLIRRHPHVFAAGDAAADGAATDGAAADAAAVNESWERRKIAEKERTSATDGVPMGQPALALAAKLVSRAARADLDVTVEGDGVGDRLFAVVEDAVAEGVDPETALRDTARRYRDALLDRERNLRQ